MKPVFHPSVQKLHLCLLFHPNLVISHMEVPLLCRVEAALAHWQACPPAGALTPTQRHRRAGAAPCYLEDLWSHTQRKNVSQRGQAGSITVTHEGLSFFLQTQGFSDL